MNKKLLMWVVIFLVVGILVAVVAGRQYPDVVWGVILAALVSLGFMIKSLSEAYEGVIIEIKQEDRYVSDDGGGSVEKQLMATILMPDGSTKKLKAVTGYEVGKYVVKRKGEPSVKVFDKKPE